MLRNTIALLLVFTLFVPFVRSNSDELNSFISMKEYIDIKIQFLEKSTSLAKEEMERRLESMNEFRDTLKDQAGTFVTRTELNAISEKNDADIQMLREFKATIDSKASMSTMYFSYLLIAINTLLALYAIKTKK